jgi:hypothetical protein
MIASYFIWTFLYFLLEERVPSRQPTAVFLYGKKPSITVSDKIDFVKFKVNISWQECFHALS